MAVEEEGLRVFQSVKIKIGERLVEREGSLRVLRRRPQVSDLLLEMRAPGRGPRPTSCGRSVCQPHPSPYLR